jgi:hypothetical protein
LLNSGSKHSLSSTPEAKTDNAAKPTTKKVPADKFKFSKNIQLKLTPTPKMGNVRPTSGLSTTKTSQNMKSTQLLLKLGTQVLAKKTLPCRSGSVSKMLPVREGVGLEKKTSLIMLKEHLDVELINKELAMTLDRTGVSSSLS